MVKAPDGAEDEDDEEENEDEEKGEMAVPKKSGKRTKEEKKVVTPAKQHKTENDASILLFVGNLNPEKNFEKLKKVLNGFFTIQEETFSHRWPN
ncbi:hypothetical protein scyTo_0003056 [Scyliorhinus torazame]|uniref:RRM domain-containing protein n=1 Tax=Scyliorhinus torazame TaxID=75743 RepID=A0A401PLF7_SCYTO|nr:hypothetical protein [Scyliorhinus torazame]